MEYATVSGDPVPDVRETVITPFVGPASVAVASVVCIVTTGSAGRSSSWIVTIALFGEPTSYVMSGRRVRATVSSPSTTVSSIGLTVIVADAAPIGRVTLPVNVA